VAVAEETSDHQWSQGGFFMSISEPFGCVICCSPPDTSKLAFAHLQVLFARSRQTLLLIARKVLGKDERADEVVANCYVKACKHFRTFADEAELRRWLVRLAIDEALLVSHEEIPALPAFMLDK
jgi:hypothetical protein